MKKHFMKRGLSLLLALVMMFGMIQTPYLTQEVEAASYVTHSNVARNDGVTVTAGLTYSEEETGGTLSVSSSYPLSNIVDGTINTNNYADFSIADSDGTLIAKSCYVQVDLGAVYDIDQINLYRYWYGTRTYNATVIAVAEDESAFAVATEEDSDTTTDTEDNTETAADEETDSTVASATVVYNSDGENVHGFGEGDANLAYPETSSGKTISFDAQKVRYIRVYMCGSSANNANHIVELQAYANVTTTFNAMAVTEKPADDTTENQPFASGTAGSTYFRIPSLITAANGDLVAAADARWETTADALGIDTIVSTSEDSGANWNYTFANYLGDYGTNTSDPGTNKLYAATFIDPEMVWHEDGTENGTIYMLADLYVGKYAINTTGTMPITGSAFTTDGYLKLKRADESTYDYYLKDGKIYDSDGNEADGGFTVDGKFNIYEGETFVSNLFFNAESTENQPPYQAYPTTYLYLTKSTDNGKTWSDPQLLNVKNDDEYFYGVGPGRGLVTSDGTIMFSCYKFAGSAAQRASFIYSKDGVNWTRSANATSTQSSESQLVELSDGTIRMFYRNVNNAICYVDATGNAEDGYTWGTPVTTSVSNCSDCQISAIMYSEKIDGKDAILVSCPTASGRYTGKIFVGLVNADKTIDWAYTYAGFGSSRFQYSCMTELADGSIGILYEDGAASITYANIAITDIAAGATIGGLWVQDSTKNAVGDITLKPGAAAEYTVYDAEGNVTVTSSDESVATVTLNGTAATADDSTVAATFTVTANADLQGSATATITVTDGTETVSFNVKVRSGDTDNYETVNLTVGETTTLTDKSGYYTNQTTSAKSSIAQVKIKATESEKITVAQAATAQGTFDGEYINLNDCLYTFTASDDENEYSISATATNGGTVYLNIAGGGATIPNQTSDTNPVTLYDANTAGAINLYDGTSGLHFHKEGGYYFNRCGSNDLSDTKHQFEIYKQSASVTDSEIAGYEQVTSVAEVTEGKYLIVALADDGNRYVLRPYSGGSNFNHVAKVTEEYLELAAGIADDSSYSDDTVEISDCLYTFSAGETDGTYVISAQTSDGTTVYLNLATTGQKPNKTSDADIQVTYVEDEGIFKLYDTEVVTSSGDVGAYLHFRNSDFYFDRCHSDDSCGDQHKYEIFAPSESVSSNQLIPGYDKVTAVEAGKQYLIAHKVGSVYYLLNPYTYDNSTVYNHVAKVGYEEIASGTTAITFTGISEGSTTSVVGDTTYYINVTAASEDAKVQTVTMKVGETYTAEGKVVSKEETQNIVTTARKLLAPYTQVTSMDDIESGAGYLIRSAVNGKNVSYTTGTVTNSAGTSFSALALYQDSNEDLNSTDYSEYIWIITADDSVENGYTVQNIYGKYLAIASASEGYNSNVTLSETPVTLKIAVNGRTGSANYVGAYGISGAQDSNVGHLNSSESTYAVGWWKSATDGDNSNWHLYKATNENTLVTANTVGQTLMVIGDTTYIFNVYDEAEKTIDVGDFLYVYGDVTAEPDPSGIVSTDEADQTGYSQVTSLDNFCAGTYLITYTKNSVNRLMMNEVVSIDDNQDGTNDEPDGMNVKTFDSTELSSNDLDAYLWTFTAVNGGYTIQDANGNYLNMTAASDDASNGVMSLSSTPQTFTVGSGSVDGTLTIKASTGHYLNNFQNDDNNIAGWTGTGTGNNLYLYANVAGAVKITGEEIGTTTMTVGGIIYTIHVVDYVDYALLNQQIAIAEVLVVDTTYTEDSRNALQTVLNAAKAYTQVTTGFDDADKLAAEQETADALAAELTAAIKALVKASKSISLQVGETRTFTVTGTLDETTYSDTEKALATITVEDGTLSVTGLAAGILQVKIGEIIYNICVAPEADGFPILAGTGQGAGSIITKLTMSADNTFDLNLSTAIDTTGKTVTWTSGDTNVLTVDENGTITPANASSTTTVATTVTVTITDENGVSESYTIPVIIHPGPTLADGETEVTKKMVNIYINEISNTDVYYSWNCGTDLIHATEGEAIYVSFRSDALVAIDFMGAPDDGYALTMMGSTNSAGHYMTIHAGDDVTLDTSEKGFLNYPAGAGAIQSGLYTAEQVMAMLSESLLRGCDGAMGFTRPTGDSSSISSNLTFRSAELPTVTKVPYGILPADGKRAGFRLYEEGMTASEGEFVYFEITVTTYKPLTLTAENKSVINYSNVILTDTALSTQDTDGVWHGASFIYDHGKDVIIAIDDIVPDPANVTKDITDDINADVWNDTETYKEHKYYVAYEITADDLDTELVNTVDLNYHYKAEYSTGEYDVAAQADASITVTSFAAQDLVVDFGLPVTAEYALWGKIPTDTVDAEGQSVYNSVMLTEGTIKNAAAYGTVEVERRYNTEGDTHNGWKITYTPTETLKGVDTVTLTAENTRDTYSFKVYPASSVYYEETFMVPDVTTEWTAGGSVLTSSQEAAQPGDTQLTSGAKANYGYDAVYVDAANSEIYTAKTTDGKEKVRFTFTGTGVDVFANCDADTGIVMVLIKKVTTDADGNTTSTLKKMMSVDTSLTLGTIDTNAGLASIGSTLNVPIVSVPAGTSGLDYGTYEVTLIHTPKKTTTTNTDGSTTTTPVETKLRLDGFRVYGTLEESEAAVVHAKDMEANPVYLDMKDSVLAGMNVDITASGDYAAQLAANALSQIYATSGNKLTGAMLFNAVTADDITTDVNFVYTDDDLVDFLDNTSKNELYLYPGQSLVFALDAATVNPQVALKALNGDVAYQITSVESGNENAVATGTAGTMTANTEMYYPLTMVTVTTTDDSDTSVTTPVKTLFTIKNTDTSNGVLAITKLKVISDATAPVLGELNELDLTMALLSLDDKSNGGTGDSPVVEKDGVIRLAGANRYATSFVTAEKLKEQLGVDKFDTVLVTTGQKFADALSGSYLAAVKNAPILLSDDACAEDVADYIKENLTENGTVYILGGDKAVSENVENAIRDAAAEQTVIKRLKGNTRYETNLEILKEAAEADSEAKEILVCKGTDYADSLAASALAKPILMVDDVQNTLLEEQKEYLAGFTDAKIYIIGGSNAVSPDLEAEISEYADDIRRVKGATRYETSVEVAKEFFGENAEVAFVAYAYDFPDGLCGGPLAAKMNAPMILTTSEDPSAAISYMQSMGIESGYVLGGNARIKDLTAKEMFDCEDITEMIWNK